MYFKHEFVFVLNFLCTKHEFNVFIIQDKLLEYFFLLIFQSANEYCFLSIHCWEVLVQLSHFMSSLFPVTCFVDCKLLF
jgi:hypothetical protein